MRSYWVYVLSCSDGSFYVGVTNDLERRINEHNFGLHETSYTYSRRPVVLVRHEEFSDVREAIAREKQLKGWGRRKKMALILSNQTDLIKLSKRAHLRFSNCHASRLSSFAPQHDN